MKEELPSIHYMRVMRACVGSLPVSVLVFVYSGGSHMGNHMNMEQLAPARLQALHRCSSCILRTQKRALLIHTLRLMYTCRLRQLKKVRGRAYISMIDDGEIFTVIASWLNKSFLFLLQGVVVLTTASWQLLDWGEDDTRRGCRTWGGECFSCVFSASPRACMFVNAALNRKRGAGGPICTRRQVWALPCSIWHKRACSYYVCWRFLRGDKVGPGR